MPSSQTADAPGTTDAPPPTVEPAAKPAEAPRRKERDPFFDNAKFLAIVLVVVGHVIVNLRDLRVVHAAYLFIYTFHMPVFILITGYLSRNFTLSGRKARKLITHIAVPYVIFEVIYSTFRWAVGGSSSFEITLLNPSFALWFLVALFMWRLSTPVWQQIRWPIGVAVVLCVLGGMSQLPAALQINRVLSFAPFYVLGLSLRPEHFELLRRPAARIGGAVVLSVSFVVTFFFIDPNMSSGWVTWKRANSTLHVDELTGSLMRLGLLVCAGILVASFLAVVPARRTWFSGLGAATLYAYLLHPYVVKLFDYRGWYDFHWMHTLPGALLLAVCAALLATALCTPPVRTVMRQVVEPNMSWAFTTLRRPKKASGARR